MSVRMSSISGPQAAPEAACSRQNLALLLTSRPEVKKLLDVEAALAGAIECKQEAGSWASHSLGAARRLWP